MGQVCMTVEIIRKDTGLAETHQLIGFVSKEDFEKFTSASREFEESLNVGQLNS